MLSTSDALPKKAIEALCRHHRIDKLSLFGSFVRDDFRPDSDIDMLVRFYPGERVGLIRLGAIEAEMSDLLGRHVDLCLDDEINPHFREEVLREARTLYDAT